MTTDYILKIKPINYLLSRGDTDNNAYTSFGLLFLRISVGLMMALSHGWGKLANFGEMAGKFADPIGLGSGLSLTLTVFAEFFCSLAVVIGLATRAAVIPLIITMLVIVFIVNADGPWGKQEFGLMFLIPYVTVLLTGPGKYSLDHILFGKK